MYEYITMGSIGGEAETKSRPPYWLEIAARDLSGGPGHPISDPQMQNI